jgi:regulatory protein
MNSLMNSHEKIIKRMRNSAISYLARYEVSEFQFRNTMIRKLSNFENELDEKLKFEIIDKIKKEMIVARYIDDKRFAESKSRSIRRQGGSERLIFAKLKEKGVSDNIIKFAIDIVDEENENAEIIAAVNFIKKKKIGVFYKLKRVDKEIDPYILKDKWYGTLSRRGFSLSIIKKVLDITDIENADFILEDNI